MPKTPLPHAASPSAQPGAPPLPPPPRTSGPHLPGFASGRPTEESEPEPLVESAEGRGPVANPGRRRASWRHWLCEATDAAGSAVREAAEALSSAFSARQLQEFADLVASARAPEEVEAALVRTAFEMSGACRVELVLDRDETANPEPRRVALAPESAGLMTADEVEALGYPLSLGLWCGDHYQMILNLYARPGKLRGGRWSPSLVRRLTTLCAMAAAADRGLYASHGARIELPSETSATVRDATFLNAVLPYALAQAQRHSEPLTVFCVEIDGIAALTRTHGPMLVELAAFGIADSVARALRASDVVAKLDDNRIVIVLPSTGRANALIVANVVREAIAGACVPSNEMPALTASIGIALYPVHALDMLGLLSAADEATACARALGPNQVAVAGPPLPNLSVFQAPPAVADAVTDNDDEAPGAPPAHVRPKPRRRPAAG